MNRLLAPVFAVLLLALSGCASVPMASLEQDVKAKDFQPRPNTAALYVYRKEIIGGAIPMTVTINGRSLGQTAAKPYFRLNLVPGRYTVESHAENISSLALTAEGDKNYFVWQEVKMGMWMARSLLQQVDDATGRAGVGEAKLIATTLAEAEITPLDAPAVLPSTGDAVAQRLKDLQKLRQDGAITEDGYQKKRQDVLAKH